MDIDSKDILPLSNKYTNCNDSGQLNVSRMLTDACQNVMASNSTDDANKIFMDRPQDMLDPGAINSAFIPIIVTHAVTFLIGVIGNSVVIGTWSVKGKLRSPTAVFLVSLAAADLLLLLVYVPLETLEYFVITWDAGGNICKLSSYVEMLSGMASVLNLVAVSIERFLVIVFPMRARRLCTMSTARKGLFAVWGLAVLLAAPVLLTKIVYPMTYYNSHTSLTAYYCWDSDDDLAFAVAVYQLLVMFALPALFMVICYFLVMQELWISTKTVTAMTMTQGQRSSNSNSSINSTVQTQRVHRHPHRSGESFVVRWTSSKNKKSNVCTSLGTSSNISNSMVHLHNSTTDVTQGRKQVIKMLVLIVVLFLLCWGPRLVMNVLIKLGLQNYTHSAYTARIACYLLSFIHSALNPFVYGFMSSNFRKMICHSCPIRRFRRNRMMNTSNGEYPLRRMHNNSQSTRLDNSFV